MAANQFYLNHQNHMQLNEWAIIVFYRIYTAKTANFRNIILQMKWKARDNKTNYMCLLILSRGGYDDFKR